MDTRIHNQMDKQMDNQMDKQMDMAKLYLYIWFLIHDQGGGPVPTYACMLIYNVVIIMNDSVSNQVTGKLAEWIHFNILPLWNHQLFLQRILSDV